MYDVKNSIKIYISGLCDDNKIGSYAILVTHNYNVIKTLKSVVRKTSLENIYFRALLEILDFYKTPMRFTVYIDNNDFINTLNSLQENSYWYNKISYNFKKHIIDLKAIEFDDDFSDYAKLLSKKCLYYDN